MSSLAYEPCSHDDSRQRVRTGGGSFQTSIPCVRDQESPHSDHLMIASTNSRYSILISIRISYCAKKLHVFLDMGRYGYSRKRKDDLGASDQEMLCSQG